MRPGASTYATAAAARNYWTLGAKLVHVRSKQVLRSWS